MKKLLLALLFLTPSWLHAAEPQEATFAAGCFWCLESIFEPVPGVLKVVSGYSGGTTENPTYEQVCTETTGHAETIDITFDPDKVSYEKLLEIYWNSHDPTDPRGVAPDFGNSYRPVLFYHNTEQKAAIEKVKVEVQKKFEKPIATEIVPFVKFWPAEGYHQDYVQKNPNNPYVRGVSKPRAEETAERMKAP